MTDEKQIRKVLIKLEEQADREILKESDLLHLGVEVWENVHQTSHAWHTSPGELMRMAAVGLFGAAIANTDLKKVWNKIVDFSTDKAKKLLGAAKVINQSQNADEAEAQLENMGLQLIPINESYKARKKKLKEGREPNSTTVVAMKKMMGILQKNIQGAAGGDFNLDEIKEGLKELQGELGTEKQIQKVHSNYEKEIAKIQQAKVKETQKAQPVEESPKDETIFTSKHNDKTKKVTQPVGNNSPLTQKKKEENKQVPSMNTGKAPIPNKTVQAPQKDKQPVQNN